MSGDLYLSGIVLFAAPHREYDRRLILLTKERGKVTAFARGARRPTSALLGSTLPLCFGRFRVFEGRSAYTLAGAQIDWYFSEVREDLTHSGYASYMMELADYYGVENLDATAMLNLLYVSLKALENPSIPDRLVRYIYEVRLMVINGEFPQQYLEDLSLSDSARYALRFMVSAPLERLYTFNLTEEVLEEIAFVQDRIRKRTLEAPPRSLAFLESLTALAVEKESQYSYNRLDAD